MSSIHDYEKRPHGHGRWTAPPRSSSPIGALLDISPQPWMEEALCAQVDGDLFYPGKGEHHLCRQAKQVCRMCPVRVECLEYALARDERFGVWGGRSERERRDLKHAKRGAA